MTNNNMTNNNNNEFPMEPIDYKQFTQMICDGLNKPKDYVENELGITPNFVDGRDETIIERLDVALNENLLGK